MKSYLDDPIFLGDCGAIYEVIKNRFKDAKSGSARRQMFENGHFGQKQPEGAYSITLGHTFRGYISPEKSREPSKIFKSKFETVYYSNNRDIYDMLKEFMGNYYPEFDWTECQINYNWQSPVHLDKGNQGESVIIGLGDYTKGELVIVGENQTHTNPDHHEYDINCKFLKFDGAKYYHYTKDYEGDRMSLVFYNIKAKKLTKKEQEKLLETNNI